MAKQSRSRAANGKQAGAARPSRRPSSGKGASTAAARGAVKEKAKRPKTKNTATRKAAPATRQAKPSPAGAPPLPASAQRNLAVETFEKGFQALQRRQYERASEMLSKVVTSYPDEKELHERARVYLAVCQRQVATVPKPKTFEERLCAATLAINKGSWDSGLELLEGLERDNASHDHVQYLLAIAHAARGDRNTAISHLRRAIELRPSNRLQARQDPDLDGLRQEPAFIALLETPHAARSRVGRGRG